MKSTSILPDRLTDLSVPCFADVFTSHMVLQADKPIPLWGFGAPGTHVLVQLGGQEQTTKVSSSGIWTVWFKSLEASYESLSLSVGPAGGSKKSVVLENVLVGELWFCSGQSNMELGVGASHDGQRELEQCEDHFLRLLLVQKSSAPIPLRSLDAGWKVSNPRTVGENGWGGFSAIAFFFGQYLRRELDCPVGLIQAAYGGAKIHPFLPPEGTGPAQGIQDYCQEHEAARKSWQQALGQGAKSVPVPEGFMAESDARLLHPFNGFDQWDTLKIGTTWNAMIHPLLPFSCRGVLWYQGESDAGFADVYPSKLKALHKAFRKGFGTKELFLVQIAPWRYGSDKDLLDLWKAQYRFCETSGCRMVSTVDVGDMNDIHPLRKRPVGERLARLALAETYKKLENAGSPELRKIRTVDQGFMVEFDVHSGALALSDAAGQPASSTARGFRFHMKDGTVAQVEGSVESDRVRLCCEKSGQVAAISYGWLADTDGNLVNESGEPAFPFYRAL